MNEENTTEEANPIETDGQAESDVTTPTEGGEGVFSVETNFPETIPPMPSVSPDKFKGHSP